MRLRLAAILAVLVAAALPWPASASELIDRNASQVSLKVARNGQALLSYTVGGKRRNVLAWGAVNAIHATPAEKQVEFRLDYSGGYGTHNRAVWKGFHNACSRYDGPALNWLVTACKASDGSYWAVQAWQRMLPNYGLPAQGASAAWELRLSHWSGEVAQLTLQPNWAYRRYHHLFGSFTYLGKPVHGFRATSSGVPLDAFGRNVYLDTFNSAYGEGWRRENGFLLVHKPTGKFCYGLYGHGSRPPGAGQRYRATVVGPGVTPDVYWEGAAPDAYDKEFDLRQHAVQKEFFAGDPLCRPV